MAPKKKTPGPADAGAATRVALLAAVVASPGDDEPRLAFADWLEKHGDRDRARFIRLGCQAAQREEDDPQRLALEKRLAALLDRHEEEWKQEAPPWARSGAAFRRGFIDSVVLSAALWIKRADKLFALVPATGARLREVRDRLAEVLAAPSLARLTWLSLGWNRLGDAGAVAVAAVPQLANLRGLELTIARVGDDGLRALAGSPHLAGLELLNLSDNRIGPAGAESLARTRRLLRLTDLDLDE